MEWRPAGLEAGKERGPLKILKRILLPLTVLIVAVYMVFGLMMVGLKWVDPITTSVQMQRRVEAWGSGKPYQKRYRPVPMSKISRELQHAVVAAEDARFREHNGIDWKQVQKVIDEEKDEGGRPRGASTITQQLIKNLFLTTKRSYIRKGFEFTLVPMAEKLLGKDRILELYLNCIEWGPGVFGAEAAAQYHFKTTAAKLTREQSVRLAAIIPNPIRRKPERMNEYSDVIQTRMRQMGW